MVKPVGKLRVPRPVCRDQFVEGSLRSLDPQRVPNFPQLDPDLIPDRRSGGAVESAAPQIALAVLPHRVGKQGLAGDAQPGMVVRDGTVGPVHAAGDEAVEESRQWTSASENVTHTPSTRRLLTDGSSSSGTTPIAVRMAASLTALSMSMRAFSYRASRIRYFVYASLQVRHVSSSSLSLLVALPTWVAEIHAIPISVNTSSKPQVETHLGYILPTATMTA